MKNKTFRSVVCMLLLVLGLALSGCGGQGPGLVVEQQFVEYSSAEKAQLDTQRGRQYRLQEEDVFNVAFSYQKELNQNDVLVLPDGSVTLVGIDRLVVAGLTLVEADSLITAAYAKDYRNPDLSLILAKTKGRQVYVMGEVDKPGLHSVPRGGIDLLSAVTIAGGFTEDADRKKTFVVRTEPDGYSVIKVDLKNFQKVGQGQLALFGLEPYDIVFVPRSGQGTFSYFNKTVLSGLAQMARIAADLKYLTGATNVRY